MKNKKKKVLHLLASNRFSGAENVVVTIIKNMSDEYQMIYCSKDGPISEKLKEDNIEFYPLKKLNYSEVKKVVDTIKPDIIHAHDNTASVIASLFSKKCLVISHIHGNNRIMNSLNIKTMLFNYCSKKLDNLIWVSDSSLDGYYFKKNIANKSIVLYNVIDRDDIVKKSNLWECSDNYDLIFLGRLGYPKNPARLIEIINMVKSKIKNVKVAIVGDGADRQLVEELIQKYKLTRNVKLYGFQSNPYPILKNSKILIMTSIYEGTPMCALEAQSLGKPIVATPVDGLKKIIINDDNGFLSDDNKLLSESIIDLLRNPKKYSKYSKSSVIKFNTINNLDRYCSKIKELYERG